MRYLLLPALLIASTAALAFPSAPPPNASPEQLQAPLKEQGYPIDTFKITPGNCYEIYGFDKDKHKHKHKHKAEIYHAPVTGQPVTSRVEN